MSITVVLDPEGQPQELPDGADAATLFRDRREVLVARVNGELVDLATTLNDGDLVEPVTAEDPDGLAVLRHSCAHVLAQAVQQVDPDAKLGIGPPIQDGFYYDFDVDRPFTPEDLAELEKRMTAIIKSGQRFSRRVVTDDEARTELEFQPYKLLLIQSKGGSDASAEPDSEIMEVGGSALTMYDNVDRRDQTVWTDLCRGPHVPTTRHIPANAFKLMRTAAVYWMSDEHNPQLQRIYGTAWPNKDQLREHLTFLAEAAKRDHRRLGAELDLFSFPEQIGSGLPVFHPKGGLIRKELEDYSRRRHEESGYEFVYSPHITKAGLFETSGHLDWYAEGMYPPMHLDAETDGEGNVRKPGQDYYLKPMNCPMHNLIFDSRGRSYRELPLRLFEFGSVYRYEKSGVVHGLTRARGFTQDDAHIYCTPEQMPAELADLLSFVLDLLRDYGLDDFYLELSTRDPAKSVGGEAEWEQATEALRSAAEAQGLELVTDPGGAAFYGPKISVQAKDAIGRYWQMSTIQVDFQLPERFGLEYTAADGSRQRPVMIHRALFGSIERFFAVLLEHYNGAFPPWLAPVQVVGVPVSDAHVDYLAEVASQMRARGIRVEIDSGSDRMPKKIRNATRAKVPFIMIAGDEDQAAGAVSFRMRDGTQDNGIPVADAIERVVEVIESKAQV
ncbi:MAG: threonine--tRNA ligase [Actinobacteria bacterium]|nr:threonine--tRNA ligase [Actinomycetota bacterium]MCB9412417.1 threonine--tRNA ligase [Actinomycetota bacterium]